MYPFKQTAKTVRALWKTECYFHCLARFSLRGKLRMSPAGKPQTPTSFSVVAPQPRVGSLWSFSFFKHAKQSSLSYQQTSRWRSPARTCCVHFNVPTESRSEILKCSFPCSVHSHWFVQSGVNFAVGKLNSLPRKSEQ